MALLPLHLLIPQHENVQATVMMDLTPHLQLTAIQMLHHCSSVLHDDSAAEVNVGRSCTSVHAPRILQMAKQLCCTLFWEWTRVTCCTSSLKVPTPPPPFLVCLALRTALMLTTPLPWLSIILHSNCCSRASLMPSRTGSPRSVTLNTNATRFLNVQTCTYRNLVLWEDRHTQTVDHLRHATMQLHPDE